MMFWVNESRIFSQFMEIFLVYEKEYLLVIQPSSKILQKIMRWREVRAGVFGETVLKPIYSC